jgi:hypothetical protein
MVNGVERLPLYWLVSGCINKVQTNFGRNLEVCRRRARSAGCSSCPPHGRRTAYGVDGDGDGDGDGKRDPADPADAITAAARYLRASGAPADWYRAIFAYDHADWYVRAVEALADAYQGSCTIDGADVGVPAGPAGAWL